MKRIVLFASTLLFAVSFLVGCTIDNSPSDTTQEVTTEAQTLMESPAEDFRYLENDNGELTISYCGTSTDVVIPAKINGRIVTTIGENAFGQVSTTLKTVYIPDTVTTIEKKAFSSCSALSDVRLPDSLQYIGEYAFENCTSLKSISILSDCLTEKSVSVFMGSGLETVNLAEGITCIPASSFSSSALKEIVLPSTVEFIGVAAFYNCNNLSSVKLNEGLKTIAYEAFGGSDKIPVLSEITIPKSVENMNEGAFTNSSIRKITFLGNAPEDFLVETDELATVGNYTIYYNESSTGFTSPVWNGYPCYQIGSTTEMAYDTNGLGYAENEQGGVTILDYKGTSKSLTIPSAINGKPVTEIGMSAFANAGFESVDIPDTVTVIESRAFFNAQITSVTLPNNLETIGKSSFRYCNQLGTVELPLSLKFIEADAFKYCHALTDIKIPKNVTMLGAGCFAYSGLTSIELGQGLTEIAGYAFVDTELSEVTISSGVKTIGEYAFSYCQKLQSVKLEGEIKTINEGAFSSTALKEITLPASLESINDSAFYGCRNLESVYFEGDAPSLYKTENSGFHSGYTIYYHEGANGFSSPEWEGYPAKTW